MDPLRYPPDHSVYYSRRNLLRTGAVLAAAAPLAGIAGPGVARTAPPLRTPGSLPYPSIAPGTFTGRFPFDHLVLVMQENHSFDNYLGMLPVSGQPKADGFTFNKRENPINWNPLKEGKRTERMYVYHQGDPVGALDTGSQNWDDTHQQIAGGRMSGFAATGPGSMGYYTEDDLPFYYSLAKTFTLANRWFCSAPAQTYPNRRFLMAGTASGVISTNLDNIDITPPNGTIWDQLSAHNISWANYFSDAPTSAIIVDTIEKHALNLRRIEQFYLDAAAGTLPSVSLVDSNMSAIQGEVASAIGQVPLTVFSQTKDDVDYSAESEENPIDVQAGQAFVSRIVNAVMSGPAWHRTLLVWFYDEHGGYYDHVAPARALAPDGVKPSLSSTNRPGDYTMYGPRVPAVVVSPYARKRAVTNVVHDHTSVLATIEHQWNLPALTRRDANAATLADFLGSKMTFAEPPDLAKAQNPAPGLLAAYKNGQPEPPKPAATTPKGGTKAR